MIWRRWPANWPGDIYFTILLGLVCQWLVATLGERFNFDFYSLEEPSFSFQYYTILYYHTWASFAMMVLRRLLRLPIWLTIACQLACFLCRLLLLSIEFHRIKRIRSKIGSESWWIRMTDSSLFLVTSEAKVRFGDQATRSKGRR